MDQDVSGRNEVRGGVSRRKLLAAASVAMIAGYVATRPSPHSGFVASGAPRTLPLPGALTTMTEQGFEGVLVGLRGTPVIVNVWASWCSPCRTETPLLERTWRAHGDRVAVVGIASKDTAGAARGFLAEFGVSYPNIFDDSGQIRAALGVRGFPTTYVFDEHGELRTSIVGGLSEQRLAAVLKDLGA